MNEIRTRLRQVTAKLEGTYSVDAAPTGAADSVLLRSVKCTPLQQDTVDRTLVRPFLGGFEKLPTKSLVMLEMELEAVGFGTAGPAAPPAGYDALLRACGLARTVNAGVSVEYSPVSSDFDSATLYFYQDGTLHKLLGARGNLAAMFEVGQIPVFKFNFMGLYGGVTDVPLPTVDLSAYQQPQVANAANTPDFTLHGYTAAALRRLEINLNNQLVHKYLINADEEIRIVDRLTSGSAQFEATRIAEQDWWTIVRDASLGDLSLSHGAATRRIQLSSSVVQISQPDFVDQDNIVEMPVQLNFIPTTAGNDEILLTIA